MASRRVYPGGLGGPSHATADGGRVQGREGRPAIWLAPGRDL